MARRSRFTDTFKLYGSRRRRRCVDTMNLGGLYIYIFKYIYIYIVYIYIFIIYIYHYFFIFIFTCIYILYTLQTLATPLEDVDEDALLNSMQESIA